MIWILSVGFCNTPKIPILDASGQKGFAKRYSKKMENIKKHLLRKIKLPQLQGPLEYPTLHSSGQKDVFKRIKLHHECQSWMSKFPENIVKAPETPHFINF